MYSVNSSSNEATDRAGREIVQQARFVGLLSMSAYMQSEEGKLYLRLREHFPRFEDASKVPCIPPEMTGELPISMGATSIDTSRATHRQKADSIPMSSLEITDECDTQLLLPR